MSRGVSPITTVLQVLLERLDLGESLPEAVATPRASQRNTPATAAEPDFRRDEEAALRAQHGHPEFTTSNEIGAVTGIEFLDRRRFVAAAEPTRRGGGSAMVVGDDRDDDDSDSSDSD